MAITSTRAGSHAQQVRPEVIGPTHALRRGAFAGIVFCGHKNLLSPLAGEPTALIAHKYVMEDSALPDSMDFARSSGAALPRWTDCDGKPTPAMCFAFTSAEHEYVSMLLKHGAIPGENLILVGGLTEDRHDTPLSLRTQQFVSDYGHLGRIGVLGYGQQGRAIAAHLLRSGIAREDIIIWDEHADSRHVAERDGWRVVADNHILETCAAVISSPLRKFASISRLLKTARASGIPVQDNAQTSSELRHWVRLGPLCLDEAAVRALRADDARVAFQTSSPSDLRAHVVREDERILARRRILHLSSGQVIAARSSEADLRQPWSGDGLNPETWRAFRRAFICLRDDPYGKYFAAREFCRDIWPEATMHLLPSEHAVDLGVTDLEHLLAAHATGRELVATMQTPIQRVVLGVAAAASASDRPIVEVGSALGGSALHLAAATACRRPPIYSIDPDAATRDIMRWVMRRAGHDDRLNQIVAPSDKAIEQLGELRSRCGLVFIDALHTANAVANDFAVYAPLVGPGGLLLFHDVCPAIHTVLEAVIDTVLPDERFQPRCLADGLLVLERTECT